MKALLVLGCLLLACGGKPGSGAGSVGGPVGGSDATGTLEGQPFTGKDALAYVSFDQTGNSFLTFWVATFDHVCGLASRNAGVKNGAMLILDLSTVDARSGKRQAANLPGDYSLAAVPAGGGTAQVAGLHTDASCKSTPATIQQPAGKVTLVSLNATGASGTFDITLPGGEHLAGGFQAVSCPAALQAATAPATSCN
jgi:hypothetical protein